MFKNNVHCFVNYFMITLYFDLGCIKVYIVFPSVVVRH